MLLSPFAQKQDPYAAGLLGYIGDPVANMPAAPNMVAPGPQKKPAFWQRMQQSFMPAPSGGLISDEDVKNARQQGLLGLGASLLADSGPKLASERVNLGQALGRGIQAGQQAYQGGIQGAVGQQAAKQQLTLGQQQIDANNAGQARAAQLQQVRQAVVQKHGQPGTGGEAAWIDAVLPDLLAAGDEEMVARLSEIRKSLAGESAAPKLLRNDLGDRVEWLDPKTMQVVKVDKAGATPRDVAAGAEQRQAMQMQRDATRTNNIATQYNNQTRDFSKRADLYQTVVASYQDPSAAGDLSLIFAYMKLLDPGSVVREGEFATAQNTGSIPDRIWAQYNKVLKGERMSPNQRDDFMGRSTMIAKQSQSQLQRYIKHYRKRAEGARVNPDDVAFDYFDGMFPGASSEFSDVGGGSESTASGGAGPLQSKYGGLR